MAGEDLFQNQKAPHLTLAEGTTPATPDTAHQRLFVDTADGLLKLVDDGGTVTALLAGTLAHSATTGKTADDHHNEDHAARHASGGADVVKLDDLSAPDDNTDLDATTGLHGLLPKLGGGTTNYLRADGSWAAPGGGMSNPMTTTGDVIYSSDGSGTPARRGIGTEGHVLKVVSGVPNWAAESGGGGSGVGDKLYLWANFG